MAQRISRAKRTVSGVRFDQPGDVATVLRVLYLVFNEGYSGDVDLAAEAIRLTRQLAATTSHEEVAGPARAHAAAPRAAPGQDRPRRQAGAAGRAGSRPLGRRPDHRGRRRAPGGPQPAIGWASTRPRPPSPRCTPTPGRSRKPTGCRSSSGTTNWSASPAARSPASTGRSRSARPTARRPAWPPSAASTRPCPATPPPPRTCTNGTATHRRRGPALRRGRPVGNQPPRTRLPHPAGGPAQRPAARFADRQRVRDPESTQ